MKFDELIAPGKTAIIQQRSTPLGASPNQNHESILLEIGMNEWNIIINSMICGAMSGTGGRNGLFPGPVSSTLRSAFKFSRRKENLDQEMVRPAFPTRASLLEMGEEKQEKM